jgi:hypothetical protein
MKNNHMDINTEKKSTFQLVFCDISLVILSISTVQKFSGQLKRLHLTCIKILKQIRIEKKI